MKQRGWLPIRRQERLPAFRLGYCFSPAASDSNWNTGSSCASSLWMWTGITSSVFSGTPACWVQILGLDSLHNHVSQMLVINLTYPSIVLVLFLWTNISSHTLLWIYLLYNPCLPLPHDGYMLPFPLHLYLGLCSKISSSEVPPMSSLSKTVPPSHPSPSCCFIFPQSTQHSDSLLHANYLS